VAGAFDYLYAAVPYTGAAAVGVVSMLVFIKMREKKKKKSMREEHS
jgi:hypothetical protein